MDLQPRSRTAVLLMTAALGLVQVATDFLPFPAVVALIVLGPVIAWSMHRERFAGFVRAMLEGTEGMARRSIAIPVAGFLLLCAALVFLEIRQPYYFTEDDNFTMGPVTIAALRGLMGGEFPTWNPYQFLGQPTSVQSMYGLTNPFIWLAFAAAHWAGQEQALIELFVIPHILAGYWAMVLAARVLGVRPLLATAASLSFILSGTALMIARDYATMAPVVVWMPLLIVAAERVRSGAGPRWAILTAIVAGLFCHAGNGQMWIYGMAFFGFALLVTMTRRAVPWVIVAALFSLALSLLLIVPQLWFMGTQALDKPSTSGIGAFWLSLILPKPLTSAGHPQAFPIPWDQMTPYYYAGTILTVCTLGALLVILAVALHNRRLAPAIALLRQNVWLLCAGGALWMAWGDSALLWKALGRLPVLASMGGPWKLVLYFHLFSALAGAVVVERLLRAYPARRRAGAAVAAAVLVLTAYSVWTTRGAFTNFAEKPYPELPREMAALFYADPAETSRGRVVSVAHGYFEQPRYVESLHRNFASWYGLSSADGYDRFVANSQVNRRQYDRWREDWVGAARAYGVRWIILHRSALAWHRWSEPFVWHPLLDPHPARLIENITPHAVLRVRRPDTMVWELSGADPLAFSAADRRPLPIELSQTGVTVDVASARGTVVVNYLDRRGIVARVDGSAVPHSEDRWGRIVVRLPVNARRLEVRYAPPWGTAALASSIVLLAGVIAAWFARRL